MKKRIKKEKNPKEEYPDKIIRWSDKALLGFSIFLFVLAVIGFVRFYFFAA